MEDHSADLLGPLPSGEHLFVIVDYYSCYFEVVEMHSVTSVKIIGALRSMFARWGTPLRTDNGPQFVSQEFELFLKHIGTEHVLVTPYWPQANDEVARQNRSLRKSLGITYSKGENWRKRLLHYLEAYHSTHSVTGLSPFKMMCGWQMRTKLPQQSPVESAIPSHNKSLCDHDWVQKF